MHGTALKIGGEFFARYLAGRHAADLLDVGGLDVNGSLRSVAPPGCRYLSVDIAAGPGVDLVLDDPYAFPFADRTFDAAVSTSCFEHDSMFWLTFLEMCRVTKEGGYIYINAPSSGRFHRHPLDCWRFYPDASLALQEWAVRCGQSVWLCESFIAEDRVDVWRDFVCIFRKGVDRSPPERPIHPDVICHNLHVAPTLEVTRFNPDMQDLRELRLLRRRLGLDANRSALPAD